MAAILSRLQSPSAVQSAIDEFVRLGRTGFLAKYGYGKSRDYLVRDSKTGELCDSKAIVGAAYGHQFPENGPLLPDDFSGGEDWRGLESRRGSRHRLVLFRHAEIGSGADKVQENRFQRGITTFA